MLQLNVPDPEVFLKSRGKTSRSCKQFISNIRDGIKYHTYMCHQKQSLVNIIIRSDPVMANYFLILIENNCIGGLLHGPINYCSMDATNWASTANFQHS